MQSENDDAGPVYPVREDVERLVAVASVPGVEGVACFRVVTGHDHVQARLFKSSLGDSPLFPLCKSWPMTREHLPDCPALLHVLLQDNCGVILPDRATSALYWTARRPMSERTLEGPQHDISYKLLVLEPTQEDHAHSSLPIHPPFFDERSKTLLTCSETHNDGKYADDHDDAEELPLCMPRQEYFLSNQKYSADDDDRTRYTHHEQEHWSLRTQRTLIHKFGT
ncbi:hypothetical protein TNCV_268581 [Trichonephila clavipes]|nr:hypothetical protein TNCV_268581 [Trichonephila clavipes]